MINRIQQSCSCIIEFIKIVAKKEIKCSASLVFYLFFPTRLINSIKDEHSCKILYAFIIWMRTDVDPDQLASAYLCPLKDIRSLCPPVATARSGFNQFALFLKRVLTSEAGWHTVRVLCRIWYARLMKL